MTDTVPIEGRALLDAVSVSEDNITTEWNELCGGGYFDDSTPRMSNGFPIWDGKRFEDGSISHAAGKAQFEPATWGWVAPACGVTDFSPESQTIAFWYLACHDYHRRTGRDLPLDLQAKRFLLLADALHDTWTSIGPTIADRYRGALAARMAAAADASPKG